MHLGGNLHPLVWPVCPSDLVLFGLWCHLSHSPVWSPKAHLLFVFFFFSFHFRCVLTSRFLYLPISRPRNFHCLILSSPDLLLFSFEHQCSFLWEISLEHRNTFPTVAVIIQHIVFFCMTFFTLWNCTACSHFHMVESTTPVVEEWSMIRSCLGDGDPYVNLTSSGIS